MQSTKTSTVDVILSNEEYHTSAMGISKSGLDMIHRSLLHYWEACINPQHERKEATPALILGSAVHCAILEPDRFLLDYICLPEGIKRTAKEAEAQYEELLLEGGASTILKADEFDTCLRMRDSVMCHPAARHLLCKGVAEQSFFWSDLITGTGVRRKIRPGWLPDGMLVIRDIKTTEDASKTGFQRSECNYLYHVQAAWYLAGYKQAIGEQRSAFIFIVIEIHPPFCIGVYVSDDPMIEVGRQEYCKDLSTYARCLKTNQ